VGRQDAPGAAFHAAILLRAWPWAVIHGNNRLVDPGTIAGLAAPATWALGDVAAMRFEVFSIAA
jgi:hypothetical protein